MDNTAIIRASVVDVAEIEPLFSLYREFYGMRKDRSAAIEFLRARLENEESALFYAKKDGRIIGFVQLYPSFSSASLKKVFILNDLYVLESERGKGVAKLLIGKAIEFCTEQKCARISLSTAKDNPAQKLYEEVGFKESTFKFYNYNL